MHKNTKETRRYDVRSEQGRWLGTFLITHDGLVACNTYYGSYSYWWTSTGYDDIRRFLLKIGTDYLLGKFSPREVYDGEATEKNIRETICRCRREGALTKDEAREEWGRMMSVDIQSEFGFMEWCRDSEIGDAWELAVHRTAPQARAFADVVWPRFCLMLREEIAKEQDTKESC